MYHGYDSHHKPIVAEIISILYLMRCTCVAAAAGAAYAYRVSYDTRPDGDAPRHEKAEVFACWLCMHVHRLATLVAYFACQTCGTAGESPRRRPPAAGGQASKPAPNDSASDGKSESEVFNQESSGDGRSVESCGAPTDDVIMTSAYQSFPRTFPSAPSQATAEHDQLPPDFHDGRRASEERLRLLMGRRPYQQPQRSQAAAPPPYPTEISFCSDAVEGVRRPFDGNVYGPPLGLDRMSLEESFGLDAVSGKGSDSEFERVFEQETQSSVELNPYSEKKMADSGMVAATREGGKKMELEGRQKSLIDRRASPQSQRLSQDIFRQHPQAQQQNRRDSPSRSTPTKRPTTSASNIISPTLAMERRHSSRPKSRPRPPVSPQNGSRIRRSNTHGTPSPQNRSRSSKARSRSRSQSARPARRKEDDYHASLFAGAALIREQLLRSMASADEAMDEAEREFMEAMIERGGRQEDLREKRRRTKEHQRRNMDEDDEFDTDYSRGISGLCRASYQSRQQQTPGPTRGSSRDDYSTGLGSEGRRL
ncbi:hypothetical protein THAOC_32942, partial [Thalassiosira oceanica]